MDNLNNNKNFSNYDINYITLNQYKLNESLNNNNYLDYNVKIKNANFNSKNLISNQEIFLLYL